jgi:hypothetical protein
MDYLKWYVEEVMMPLFSPRQPAHSCKHGNDWLACQQCDAAYMKQSDHQHEWLRDDNGVTECAVCGATRNSYE